jgi:hypothetical protein
LGAVLVNRSHQMKLQLDLIERGEGQAYLIASIYDSVNSNDGTLHRQILFPGDNLHELIPAGCDNHKKKFDQCDRPPDNRPRRVRQS